MLPRKVVLMVVMSILSLGVIAATGVQQSTVSVGTHITAQNLSTSTCASPCAGNVATISTICSTPSSCSIPSYALNSALPNCTTATKNADFTISGATLQVNPSGPDVGGVHLVVGSYPIGIATTVTGAYNTPACFGQTISVQPVGPVLSVNGSTTGATVNTSSTMTVAMSNGPGNQPDFIQACPVGTGPGTGVGCANYGFNLLYLNCTESQPTTPPYPTSATCTNFVTPPTAGSYVAYLTTGSGTANLASAPFTAVSGSVSITNVTLTPNTVNVGFSGTVGAISTTCSATCPGAATYTLPTTAVTGCTAAQIADNGSFAISGANLNTTSPLGTVRIYNVGVVDTMPNAGTGACWPVPVTVTSAGQQITVNGQSSGALVGAGANMTVAVTGGPGTGQTVSSFVSVCSGTLNQADCDGTYSRDYLGNPCSHTQPGSVQNAASCTLVAPNAAGNFVAAWFPTSRNDTPLAQATFSVPQINSVTMSPSSFTVGNAYSGTLTAACSTPTCPATPIYSLTTNATRCPINNNSSFSAPSGSTLSTSTIITTPGTYYACLAVAMSGAANSGQAFSVPVVANPTTTSGCLPDIPCPPCPRGCTWTLVYNDDFTDGHVMNISTNSAWQPPGCNDGTCSWFYQNGMWWVPADGGIDPNSAGGTFECYGTIGSVMLSSGSGYIQLLPNSAGIGAWETGKADSYVCTAEPAIPLRVANNGTQVPMLYQYVGQVSPSPGIAAHGLVAGSTTDWGPFCDPAGHASFEGQFTEVHSGGTGGYPELEGNAAFGCPNIFSPTLWNYGDGSWHTMAQLLDPGQDASHQGGYTYYFDDMTNASFFTNTEQCAGPSSMATCAPTTGIPIWQFYVGTCCWPQDKDTGVPSGFYKVQKVRLYLAGPVSCNNTIGSPGSHSYSCQ
jgi:hypothetical protein